MKTERKTYTREYKLEAVRLSLEDGRAGTEVARELGIHPNLLTAGRRSGDRLSLSGREMKASDEEGRRGAKGAGGRSGNC